MARRHPAQHVLVFPRKQPKRPGWGGHRQNAGRPPLAPGRRKEPPHRSRGRFESVRSFHITLRVVNELRNLRRWRIWSALVQAFSRAKAHPGFRVIQFSVQDGHIHLLAEVDHWKALFSGAKGLEVRTARALNRTLGRRGRAIAGRYHTTSLSGPRHARNAMVYVLQNHRKHFGQASGERLSDRWTDRYSSAAWFDGWTKVPPPDEWNARLADRVGVPVSPPRKWLLSRGWWERGGGRIQPGETPRYEPPLA